MTNTNDTRPADVIMMAMKALDIVSKTLDIIAADMNSDKTEDKTTEACTVSEPEANASVPSTSSEPEANASEPSTNTESADSTTVPDTNNKPADNTTVPGPSSEPADNGTEPCGTYPPCCGQCPRAAQQAGRYPPQPRSAFTMRKAYRFAPSARSG